jgi:hypothetical protein
MQVEAPPASTEAESGNVPPVSCLAADHTRAHRRRRFKGGLERRARLQEMALQKFLVYFSCAVFGQCILVALCLFCLQGFHLWGFHLEESLMHWLGGATIGALTSLLTIVYKRLV